MEMSCGKAKGFKPIKLFCTGYFQIMLKVWVADEHPCQSRPHATAWTPLEGHGGGRRTEPGLGEDSFGTQPGAASAAAAVASPPSTLHGLSQVQGSRDAITAQGPLLQLRCTASL